MQKSLMLSDGCIGASNVTECASVDHGVFSTGLHSVVQSYISTANSVLGSIPTVANVTQQVTLIH